MSKRIYITLNPNKDKDAVILGYLSNTYSEAETIKSILYQVATNGCNEVKVVHQEVRKSDEKNVVKGDTRVNEERIVAKSTPTVNDNLELDDDIKKYFG